MFLDDIETRLVAQSVVVASGAGRNIFKGSGAIIPAGAGPFMTVTETGGTGPTRIQNQAGAATVRPTAQIMVRADSYVAARTMARAAYVALDGVYNTTLNSVVYLSITARQEPTDMGLEEGTNRKRVVFNIDAEKQPS